MKTDIHSVLPSLMSLIVFHWPKAKREAHAGAVCCGAAARNSRFYSDLSFLLGFSHNLSHSN